MIFVLAVLTLAACAEYDINEVLLVRDDVSLTLRGKPQYVFAADDGQMATNADRTIYRYMTDDLMNWLDVKCQSKPGGVGENIIADIKWKSTISSGEENNLEFEIKQTDGSGMIWLWNKSNNIGLVIRDFE